MWKGGGENLLCSVVGENVERGGENGSEREHAKAIYLMGGKKTPNQLPHGPQYLAGWP